MLAVSFTDEVNTKKYLSDSKSRIPTISLPEARSRALYRIRTIPALLVFGKNGLVEYAQYGEMNETNIPVNDVFQSIETVD